MMVTVTEALVLRRY